MDVAVQPVLKPARANIVLAVLFLGTFILGSAELVVVGIIDLIAKDMSVSVSTAGTLVTSYALGICIGGPILSALTIRFGRRAVLRWSLGAYVLGNVVVLLAVNFGVFLLARIATGALQGLFIGVAFAVGTSVVPPQRIGRAISVVLGGIAVSTALGVPLGTFVGQQWGWRMTFILIATLGVIALLATFLFIPQVPNAGVGGFGAQARHALAPRVLAVLGVGFLVMGGQFATLTYLTPFLQDVTGISGSVISVFLLVYGVANAVGTFAGGWAADRNAKATLVVASAILALALGGLYIFGSSPILVGVALAVWGIVGFGLTPSLQYRVVSLAGPGKDFAATLPVSAVTGGIAVGSLIGGWALANNGPSGAVITGLVICALAIPAAWATGFLKPPTPANSQDDAVTPAHAASEPVGVSSNR